MFSLNKSLYLTTIMYCTAGYWQISDKRGEEMEGRDYSNLKFVLLEF